MPFDLEAVRQGPSRLWRMLANNAWLKLLALAVGALSYFGIRNEMSFEVRYEVPIKVEVAEGIAVLDQQPTAALVTLRGSQEDLRELDQSRLSVVVQAKASDPSGSEMVSLRPRDVKGAGAVRPTTLTPPHVVVTFDVEDERPFPVQAPTAIGQPVIGHAELSFEPRAVLIRGPRRQLNRMQIEGVKVKTEPVDVDGRVNSFSKRVRVLSPGTTWVSHIEPQEITVNVEIVTETVVREWTNMAVLAVTEPGFSGRLRIDPPTVLVRVSGGAETVSNLSSNAVRAFVDVGRLEPARTSSVPVHVYVPGLRPQEASARPSSVRVHLEE